MQGLMALDFIFKNIGTNGLTFNIFQLPKYHMYSYLILEMFNIGVWVVNIIGSSILLMV